MSSFCKCKKATHIFFSKNISVYAIFNDQSFIVTLTNNIVNFEQLGPEVLDWILASLTSFSIWMVNSADPDQILHFAASDLGLYRLLWIECPNTYMIRNICRNCRYTELLHAITDLNRYIVCAEQSFVLQTVHVHNYLPLCDVAVQINAFLHFLK